MTKEDRELLKTLFDYDCPEPKSKWTPIPRSASQTKQFRYWNGQQDGPHLEPWDGRSGECPQGKFNMWHKDQERF